MNEPLSSAWCPDLAREMALDTAYEMQFYANDMSAEIVRLNACTDADVAGPDVFRAWWRGCMGAGSFGDPALDETLARFEAVCAGDWTEYRLQVCRDRSHMPALHAAVRGAVNEAVEFSKALPGIQSVWVDIDDDWTATVTAVVTDRTHEVAAAAAEHNVIRNLDVWLSVYATSPEERPSLGRCTWRAPGTGLNRRELN